MKTNTDSIKMSNTENFAGCNFLSLPTYNKPPLPFIGNKKNALKNLKIALHDLLAAGNITEETVFYDVFGGSGLVSHFIKKEFPNNRVVWNDYDNYKSRLDILHETEQHRQKIVSILHGLEIKNKIPEKECQAIKDYLKNYENFDYITLSSYILFSGNYAENEKDFLSRKTYYSRVSYSPLQKCGYLLGVERVCLDFRDCIQKAYKEAGNNAFLVLDPPYIQTEKGHYKNFFGLKDFLELVSLMRKPYIYFSSAKSEILHFIDFCNNNENFTNVFHNVKIMQHAINLHCGNNKVDLRDFCIYPNENSLFHT